MALVKLQTQYPYDLFTAWTDEVYEKVADISNKDNPVYITFLVSDSDINSTYVYLLENHKNIDQSCNIYNKIYDCTDNPVYCNPNLDMSVNTLLDLAVLGCCEYIDNIYNLPYAETAIEDISISDVAKSLYSLQEKNMYVTPLYDHYDSEIKDLCMFVNLAIPDSDTTLLKSFISQIIVDKGYDEHTMFGEDISPYHHSELELKSELMRCNKELYLVYKQRKMEDILYAITNDSRSKSEIEHGLSGLAYEMLCDHVVYCTGSLWCFADGIWREYSSDGCIWNFLTSQFITYLTINRADKVALHIKSVNVRSRILKDIKLRLQNDFFYTLLDSRTDTIHMKNGIYNTKNMQLRDSVPSDYVSVTAGVPYQIFDDTSAKIKQLIYILGSIFPDEVLLDFFILSCSTFIEGYNSQKVFFIWWGTGNNAKTLVQTLVMKAFGEYCSTAPTSVVTGKRAESSNATPELCHVEKKLVVFLQEPNPDEKIKSGRMKEMTGNDKMYIRQLFKSGRTIMLKAKIVIVCNNIIEVPGMDSAIRRRMIVIPFISTFLNPREYHSRQQRGILEQHSNIIDPLVEKELLDCKSAFMYLLFRRYNEWINSPNPFINVPDVIREVSEDYITRNNYPLKFISNFVHYTAGSFVSTAEIYESFKEWFRKSYPGKKVPDFEVFTKELSEEGYHENGRNMIDDVFVSYSGEAAN